MNLLQSLLDASITQSQELVYQMGRGVWSAMEAQQEGVSSAQSALLSGLSDTLVEFFLLPVNFNQNTSAPGMTQGMFSLWSVGLISYFIWILQIHFAIISFH